jgi:hypothetical protein
VICKRCGQREASSNHIVGRIVYPPDDPRHEPTSATSLPEPYPLCDVCISEVAGEIVDSVRRVKRTS